MRRSLTAALLLGAAFLSPLAGRASADPVEITARRIEHFGIAGLTERFGRLTFLGGLDLVGHDRRFGGWSGIAVSDDGAGVLMISDNGYYLTGTMEHEAGRLTGFGHADMGTLFPGGPESKQNSDAEDVALDPKRPGCGLISLERRSTPLLSFCMKNGRTDGFKPVPVPPDVLKLRFNRSLESVAYAPPTSPAAGRVVIIGESPFTREGKTMRGWILGSGSFEIVRHDDYDISSARFMPNGDLMLLERRFTPATGIRMRLVLIPGETIKPGATVDGEMLLDVGMATQIDNMEGLDIHRLPDGRTVVTLVSDDNTNILERTLLLQFRLD
ncbi:hypothetical protein SAMN05216548_10278 [Faunimonas pinastri]|uniref:Phytase-like domain-containing protein n=1 Tax=Faunimonas pinastri TaxID=1855383 RepID=A0A1H9C9G6_9HYPH|nr:esterase-like activity of phytase family protein [Faunimonas pinastri]SEP97328.1 hypothetical protein SAMN05216548_10278 [Faunimonas pinastri]